jgi:hypothetical protein
MNPLTVSVCNIHEPLQITVLFACSFRRDRVPNRDMVDTRCQHGKLITRYQAWLHLAVSVSLYACLSSSVCTLTAVSFIKSYVTLDTTNETVEVATKWGLKMDTYCVSFHQV